MVDGSFVFKGMNLHLRCLWMTIVLFFVQETALFSGSFISKTGRSTPVKSSQTLQNTSTPSPVNHNTFSRFDIFMLSVRNGNRGEVVQFLIEEGDFLNRFNRFQQSPLILATRMGRIEVVKELISQPGILLNQTNLEGQTALMIAVELGHLEIVSALLSQESIFLEQKDHVGLTAFMIAKKNNHMEMKSELLKKQSDIFLEQELDQVCLESLNQYFQQPGIHSGVSDQSICAGSKWRALMDFIQMILHHRNQFVSPGVVEKIVWHFLSARISKLDYFFKIPDIQLGEFPIYFIKNIRQFPSLLLDTGIEIESSGIKRVTIGIEMNFQQGMKEIAILSRISQLSENEAKINQQQQQLQEEYELLKEFSGSSLKGVPQGISAAWIQINKDTYQMEHYDGSLHQLTPMGRTRKNL